LTPEQIKAIDPIIRQFAKDLKDTEVGPCRLVNMHSKSPFKSGGTDIKCDLLVCSDGKDGWRISGSCNYTCEPTKWTTCPCGSSGTMNMHALQGQGLSPKPCGLLVGKPNITLQRKK